MTEGKIRHFKYVPNGFVDVWIQAGWRALPEVLTGTGHGEYSTYMEWAGEGEPVCPQTEAGAGDDLSDIEAAVAVITGDRPGERFITLGAGDGGFQRWRLSEELARKIRRELNARLD